MFEVDADGVGADDDRDGALGVIDGEAYQSGHFAVLTDHLVGRLRNVERFFFSSERKEFSYAGEIYVPFRGRKFVLEKMKPESTEVSLQYILSIHGV